MPQFTKEMMDKLGFLNQEETDDSYERINNEVNELLASSGMSWEDFTRQYVQQAEDEAEELKSKTRDHLNDMIRYTEKQITEITAKIEAARKNAEERVERFQKQVEQNGKDWAKSHTSSLDSVVETVRAEYRNQKEIADVLVKGGNKDPKYTDVTLENCDAIKGFTHFEKSVILDQIRLQDFIKDPKKAENELTKQLKENQKSREGYWKDLDNLNNNKDLKWLTNGKEIEEALKKKNERETYLREHKAVTANKENMSPEDRNKALTVLNDARKEYYKNNPVARAIVSIFPYSWTRWMKASADHERMTDYEKCLTDRGFSKTDLSEENCVAAANGTQAQENVQQPANQEVQQEQEVRSQIEGLEEQVNLDMPGKVPDKKNDQPLPTMENTLN